jgi:hypothetical protein
MPGIDSYTKFISHLNGTDGDNGFLDYSSSPHIVSRYGNVILNSTAQLGNASVLLDGSGDYLTSADNEDWNFGTGDFTIDFRFKINTLSTNAGLVGQYVNSTNRWSVYLLSSGKLGCYFTVGGVVKGYYETGILTLGTIYHHLEVVRNGSNAYIFLDGISQSLTTFTSFGSNDVGNLSSVLYIGQTGNSSEYFNGRIDELRISKGIARHISNFTPSIVEYTTDSYTKLLLHFNSPFIDNSSLNYFITPYGDAQIDTAQSVFGGASGLFDGSGDWIAVNASVDWAFGTGDFTLDLRVRFNILPTAGNVATFFSTNNGTIGLLAGLYNNSGNYQLFLQHDVASVNSSNLTITTGIWYHFAIVMASNIVYFFQNGNAVGSIAFNKNFDDIVSLSIGARSLTNSLFLNGWIDEPRISKGIARWTSNFTPPAGEYTDYETSNIAETINLDDNWAIQSIPELKNIIETVNLNDDWTIEQNPTVLNINETVNLNDNWNLTIYEVTDYGSQIIWLNPLIIVTNSNPAKISSIDITDPTNPIKTTVELVGCKNAKGVVYNSTNEYFYVICAEGKVCKVNKNDLNEQIVINTGETDLFYFTDALDTFLKTYAITDNSTGEIVMIDEREIKQINTDFRWLKSIQKIISTRLDWIFGKLINTDFRWIADKIKILKTDFRWLKYSYEDSSLYPIDYTKWIVKINNVNLVALDDIDMNSITITHDITAEEVKGSTATFILHRRHDRLNYDNQGNSSQITNQNNVIIEINGHVEFTGKISNLNCNSEAETITVTAIGTRPTDKRHIVNLPLPSLNEDLNLYHCILNNPVIDNPYIDPNEETPQYYKGIKVNLGTKIEQNILRYSSMVNSTTLAEQIEDGTFTPKQNWTYFWLAKFEHLILGLKQITLSYLGTSLGSMSCDAWKITGAAYKYQKELEDTETDLGEYTVGSAPYNEISVTNGWKITHQKWVDKKDGLYNVKEEGYDYREYAKRIVDLEYQKLLNINGQILPATSCQISLSIDAYYYYNIGLLTRINITNTTTPNEYNYQQGFPVAVKTITLRCSTQGQNSMITELICDNLKSQLELEEIDAQYPEETSEEFLFPETSIRMYQKFDPNSWSYPD